MQEVEAIIETKDMARTTADIIITAITEAMEDTIVAKEVAVETDMSQWKDLIVDSMTKLSQVGEELPPHAKKISMKMSRVLIEMVTMSTILIQTRGRTRRLLNTHKSKDHQVR